MIKKNVEQVYDFERKGWRTSTKATSNGSLGAWLGSLP